jgi:serine/threonine protein kinase, bacterial
VFEYNIDGVSFKLREQRDLSFLSEYGEVFCVFEENDSGNISFGVERNGLRCFVKVAGLITANAVSKPDQAVSALRNAMPVYHDLKHPALIELVEHGQVDDLYVAVFRWAEGECLFDHWNFAVRPKTHPESPYSRFKRLPLDRRVKAFETICSFFRLVARKGYVAIDFYDGSIMYDFEKDVTTICDVDFFARTPYINTMGRMWGSSRFMSPEEHELGAVIDEVTNVFTLGATAFMVFGDDRDHSFGKRNANRGLFEVATKANSPSRVERYRSIEEFCMAWGNAM